MDVMASKSPEKEMVITYLIARIPTSVTAAVP